MIYLLGSIVLTSYLTLSFKVLERSGINSFEAIVFNYVTCVVTGSVVNQHFPISNSIVHEKWFIWACVMGGVFILLFNVIAYTAQTIGVAVASVANKLSLVVPFIFSIYLYNEESTVVKFLGILVAMVAVILTCYPGKNSRSRSGSDMNWSIMLVPFGLFLGSGLLDTMIKYVEHQFLDQSNQNSYLITAFTSAAAIGIFLLVFKFFTGRQHRFSWKTVLAGIAIGIPNYFSIWCLLKVLKQYPGYSSAIIPINNMGIVLFSSVVAWLMFKEKLSAVNWLGITLSIAAIALIAY